MDSSVRKEMLRRDLPSEDEFDKDAEPREGSDGEEEDLDDESVAATAISFVLHGIEETAATAARAAFEVNLHIHSAFAKKKKKKNTIQHMLLMLLIYRYTATRRYSADCWRS